MSENNDGLGDLPVGGVPWDELKALDDKIRRAGPGGVVKVTKEEFEMLKKGVGFVDAVDQAPNTISSNDTPFTAEELDRMRKSMEAPTVTAIPNPPDPAVMAGILRQLIREDNERIDLRRRMVFEAACHAMPAILRRFPNLDAYADLAVQSVDAAEALVDEIERREWR